MAGAERRIFVYHCNPEGHPDIGGFREICVQEKGYRREIAQNHPNLEFPTDKSQSFFNRGPK